MDLKILELLALVSVLQLLKVNATKSLLLDFSNIDITDPPTTGVNSLFHLLYYFFYFREIINIILAISAK